MQRIDPRPEPAQQQQPQQQQQQPPAQQDRQQQQGQWAIPTGFASTGSQAHTQSFEEIYGIPENFLEIEVGRAHTNSGNNMEDGGYYREEP